MTDKTIEVWIVINGSGEYEVATDETIAMDRWNDEFGQDCSGALCRLVKLNITMSPSPLTEVDVRVPDDAGQIVQIKSD